MSPGNGLWRPPSARRANSRAAPVGRVGAPLRRAFERHQQRAGVLARRERDGETTAAPGAVTVLAPQLDGRLDARPTPRAAKTDRTGVHRMPPSGIDRCRLGTPSFPRPLVAAGGAAPPGLIDFSRPAPPCRGPNQPTRLTAPGRRQRPPLPARAGRAALLRCQGEVMPATREVDGARARRRPAAESAAAVVAEAVHIG